MICRTCKTALDMLILLFADVNFEISLSSSSKWKNDIAIRLEIFLQFLAVQRVIWTVRIYHVIKVNTRQRRHVIYPENCISLGLNFNRLSPGECIQFFPPWHHNGSMDDSYYNLMMKPDVAEEVANNLLSTFFSTSLCPYNAESVLMHWAFGSSSIKAVCTQKPPSITQKKEEKKPSAIIIKWSKECFWEKKKRLN